jgi:hypothetical protein
MLKIVWSDYLQYRAQRRGFDLNDQPFTYLGQEPIISYTANNGTYGQLA